MGNASSSRSDALNHNIVLISVHRAPSEAAIFSGISLHDPRDVISSVTLSRAFLHCVTLLATWGGGLARPFAVAPDFDFESLAAAPARGGRTSGRAAILRLRAAAAFIFLATRARRSGRWNGDRLERGERLPALARAPVSVRPVGLLN